MAWYNDISPLYLERTVGLSADEVSCAEQRLGLFLPDDYRDFIVHSNGACIWAGITKMYLAPLVLPDAWEEEFLDVLTLDTALAQGDTYGQTHLYVITSWDPDESLAFRKCELMERRSSVPLYAVPEEGESEFIMVAESLQHLVERSIECEVGEPLGPLHPRPRESAWKMWWRQFVGFG